MNAGHSGQRLKDRVETAIVRRFMRGERLLDVGIGTGRASLPLLGSQQLSLTGVDASAAMIECCGKDPRATSVRLLKCDLERLAFADKTFDTVMSVDTFAHFPDWVANLDELLRVTTIGGRVIVDVGSRDHVDAVARSRGCSPGQVQSAELGAADEYVLRLSLAQLRDYAAERGIALVAVMPYGAVLGSLVPNYWISESYAFRSGAIDRLVSWIGADPSLFAFAEFIERRIVQESPASVSGRMFVVFERFPSADVYHEPVFATLAERDERGPEAWHAEFAAFAEHEPNRAFAATLLLAAWPAKLSAALRETLPDGLLRELERCERAARVDDVCTEVVGAWRAAVRRCDFHGVDLSDVFGTLLRGEVRWRLEEKE